MMVNAFHATSTPRRSTEIVVSREVAAGVEEVRTVLHTRPVTLIERAFPESAADASTSGATLRLPGLRALRVPVVVEFRTPEPGHTGAVIALSWRARRLARAFPVMEADLRLRALGAHATEIVLAGRYVVPLGLLGLIGDQLVGAAGARATAGQFLDDLARALEAGAATPNPA